MNMNPLTAKEAKEWSYKMRLRFQKNVLRNIERSVMMGKTSVDKINICVLSIGIKKGGKTAWIKCLC